MPTRRFPSDPETTILETNDVAVLLRSDHREHIDAAQKAMFDADVLHGDEHPPRVRGRRLRRQAEPAEEDGGRRGRPRRGSDPRPAELFLGFTSTQKAGLGPRLIANLETLGFVDLRGGYFRGGTHMHLSHITEDLEAWYLNFDYDERVLTAFRPGLTGVQQGPQTVPQGPER